jgi:hypothetical protein
MQNGCEYIEKSVANRQHGVVLHVGGLTRKEHPLTLKNHVTKCYIILLNLKDIFCGGNGRENDLGGPCGMNWGGGIKTTCRP